MYMRNMLKIVGLVCLVSLVGSPVLAQRSSGNPAADHWVDSVFKTLSKKECGDLYFGKLGQRIGWCI